MPERPPRARQANHGSRASRAEIRSRQTDSTDRPTDAADRRGLRGLPNLCLPAGVGAPMARAISQDWPYAARAHHGRRLRASLPVSEERKRGLSKGGCRDSEPFEAGAPRRNETVEIPGWRTRVFVCDPIYNNPSVDAPVVSWETFRDTGVGEVATQNECATDFRQRRRGEGMSDLPSGTNNLCSLKIQCFHICC